MAFTPVTFTDDVVSDGRGPATHFPEADYLGVVKGCNASPADHAGAAPYFMWKLFTVKGPLVGRSINYVTTLSEKGQFGLGNILFHLGLRGVAEQLRGKQVATYEAFAALAKSLGEMASEKQIGMFISDGSYNGKVVSNVTEVYAPEEYEQRASLKATEAPEEESAGPTVMVAPLGMEPAVSFAEEEAADEAASPVSVSAASFPSVQLATQAPAEPPKAPARSRSASRSQSAAAPAATPSAAPAPAAPAAEPTGSISDQLAKLFGQAPSR